MKFNTFPILTLLSATSIALTQAQGTTTTKYSPAQLSSASAAALSADGPIIYDFLLEISMNLQEYLDYIQTNKLDFPDDLYNYLLNLETVENTSKLPQMISTASFPFDEFITFATLFSQYSSITSKDGRFLTPGDFLTGINVASVETGSSDTSLSSDTISTTVKISYSTHTASSEIPSSSSTPTASNNGSRSIYVPALGLSLLVATLF